MPRTLLPLHPAPPPPSGAEIFVLCPTPTCSGYVSVILGDGSLEEAQDEALCTACTLELMAKRRTAAA